MTKQEQEKQAKIKELNEQIEKLQEKCKEDIYNLCEIEIDIEDYGDIEEVEQCDNIRESISCAGEIIYYSNAMKYLSENDQSLAESIEIAVEYGFELESINSELLASLLNKRNIECDFYDDGIKIIKEYFSNLEELQEEIENIEEEEEED